MKEKMIELSKLNIAWPREKFPNSNFPIMESSENLLATILLLLDLLIFMDSAVKAALLIWGYLSLFLKRVFLHGIYLTKGKLEEMGSILAYIFNVLLTSPNAVNSRKMNLPILQLLFTITINGGVVENLDRNFWSRNELFAFCISNLYHPFPIFFYEVKKLKSATEGFRGFVA